MLPEWFELLGLMAWPLLICSIIAVMICIERFIFFSKALIQKKKQYQLLAASLSEYQDLPKDIRDELLELKITELHAPYFSGTKLLRVIGTISPIIGLLGTVLGIIAAFKIISVQTGPVSPSMIADGLWEAMLTTAAGLFIALPCLLMSYLFQHLAERQINYFCAALNKLSLSYETNKNQQENNAFSDNVERLSA